MIIAIATIPGRADKREETVAALGACAAASRGDAGCLAYSFASDVEDPDRYLSVEQWSDQAALDAHMGQPHVQALLAQLGDLLGGAPSIFVHEVASSRQTL